MNARPRWLLCVQGLLLLASVILSTSVTAGTRLLSIEELAVNAKVIAVGKILVTRVELQPEEVLKGVPPADRISLVQLGGRSENLDSMVAEAPSFTEGERVAVFLVPRRDGHLAVMALYQGKFSVERDPT